MDLCLEINLSVNARKSAYCSFQKTVFSRRDGPVLVPQSSSLLAPQRAAPAGSIPSDDLIAVFSCGHNYKRTELVEVVMPQVRLAPSYASHVQAGMLSLVVMPAPQFCRE